MKKKPTLSLLVLFGSLIVFVIGSLFLVRELSLNNEKLPSNNEVLAFFENHLPPRSVGYKDDRKTTVMPVVQFEGRDYSAMIEVDKFGVSLPVIAEWNNRTVSRVPCVFTGSPYDGTLVIGGFDSAGQFDFLSFIDSEDSVVITDMHGSVFRYSVVVVRHTDNAKYSSIIDDSYDLTLFAKSSQTGKIILVRCNMK